MLLPEDGLDRLIEQLRGMTSADRKAILARLTTEEQRRIRARLGRRAAGPIEPVSPYSPDIAARLVGADTGLTATGRQALERFVSPVRTAEPRQDTRGNSLAHALGGMLRPRGKLS